MNDRSEVGTFMRRAACSGVGRGGANTCRHKKRKIIIYIVQSRICRPACTPSKYRTHLNAKVRLL